LRTVIDAVSKIVGAGADLYEGMIVGIVVVLAVTFSQKVGRVSVKKYFATPIGFATIPVLGLVSGMCLALFFWTNSWYDPWKAVVFGVFVTVCLAIRAVIELRRTDQPKPT
jgi:Na+/H+-translocating membrane pyrophosphatase